MKYLILGGEGQIGKSLQKYLKSQGHSVDSYDLKNNEHEDLRHENSFHLAFRMQQCDFIYFLAFDVGGSKYLNKYQDSSNFIINNMQMMSHVFSTIQLSKKPFLFTSTQMSFNPNSSYGMLKKLGEKITLDLGGIGVKLWNVYGEENEDDIKNHVITDFIKSANEKGVIRIKTNGEEERQFLFNKDCSECLYELSLNYFLFSNKIWDVSSFKWTKIYEIANIIHELSGVPIFCENESELVDLNPKIEPNKDILQYWQPKTTLFEGIQKLYNEYTRNI